MVVVVGVTGNTEARLLDSKEKKSFVEIQPDNQKTVVRQFSQISEWAFLKKQDTRLSFASFKTPCAQRPL